jgi:hypothetical protein
VSRARVQYEICWYTQPDKPSERVDIVSAVDASSALRQAKRDHQGAVRIDIRRWGYETVITTWQDKAFFRLYARHQAATASGASS